MARIKIKILDPTQPKAAIGNVVKYYNQLMIEVRNPAHNKYNPRINRQPFLSAPKPIYTLTLRCTYNKKVYNLRKDSKGWYIVI